jgi:hypothetical protein
MSSQEPSADHDASPTKPQENQPQVDLVTRWIHPKTPNTSISTARSIHLAAPKSSRPGTRSPLTTADAVRCDAAIRAGSLALTCVSRLKTANEG